jgi:ferrochelatase
MKPVAVLLLNLGGPDSLPAVRPFLYNLFSDREIIRLGPAVMQKPLAYLISTLRHKKTESYYRLIGGKSPILDITKAQAKALEAELNSSQFTIHNSRQFKVYLAMRYWHPLIDDIVPRIHKDGIERVIALGLYPHYSIATTGSSISRLMDVAAGFPLRIFNITSWFDNPLYIKALVENIRKGLESFAPSPLTPHPSPVHVLFSAHSLPVKFIEEGDPYEDHIKGTIEKVTRVIGMPWSLSYQSKSGPVQWLEPSTEKMLEELADKGVKNLLVVPISFVSDHIETLYEIDILYRNMAEKLGIRLERVESLNTSPLFISALMDIVLRGMKEAGWEE